MKYACDYCDFLDETQAATEVHEAVCKTKSMLGFLGVEISRDVVKKLVDRSLIDIEKLVEQHAEAVESVAISEPDEAFGHPGRAVKMVKCPGDIQKECKYCTHRHPHKPNEYCNIVSGCVCVEVKR